MNRRALLSLIVLAVALVIAALTLMFRQGRIPTVGPDTKPNLTINYPASSPERVVENFYAQQLQARQKGDKNSGSQYLSDQFKQVVATADMGDPIFCSPTTPSKITYDRAEISGNEAIVPTHIKTDADRTIKVSLQLAGNEWRISAINCL